MMNESSSDKMLSWQEFERVEMRVATIIAASPFPKAKRPAYKLKLDLGEYGTLHSSAQITIRYSLEELIGKQVIVVVNFPPKQIADMMSECLVLGAVEDNGVVTLLSTDMPVANGLRIA